MQSQIEQDLKAALLSGDKETVETLRGLKSALLNEAIAAGARDTGLNDEQIQKVLAREAKKRQEAADLYNQGGSAERAQKELSEKAVIEKYLPEQMGEAEVTQIVDEEVAKIDNPTIQNMGQIMGAVKARTAGQADGGLIAKLVKDRLGS